MLRFQKNDTSYTRKPYKISKQQFLNDYGQNDTTRALIKYCFSERKSARRGLFVSAGITALSSVLFDAFINRQPEHADIIAALAIGIPLGLGIWIGGLAVIICSYHLLRTSKRRLYKILSCYKNGKPLPRKIISGSRFQKIVKEEKAL